MNWNEHQRAIFDCMQSAEGHVVVIARAGTGKTTTILEAIKHVPPGKRILLCAFNARIRDELKAKAPRGVTVQTLHGLGRSALSKGGFSCQLEKNKAREIAKKLCTVDDRVNYLLAAAVCQVVGLAKNTLCSEKDELLNLILGYNIVSSVTSSTLADIALTVMSLCKEDISMIDFDDMIWFPCVHNVHPRKYDVVFVDEAQDLNPAQRWLVERAVAKGGRLVAVGDDRQAIYQFRGAGKDVLTDIISQFNAQVLPLSVTYRCPKKVVAIAKRIVPDYEAADTAPEGTVGSLHLESLAEEVQPGDFVLSRSSAPLMRVCMDILSIGKPATITGKDIGRSLNSLIKKSGAVTTPQLEDWLSTYKSVEREKLLPEHEDKFAEICDRVEAIRVLSEGLATVSELTRRIEGLFADDKNDKEAHKKVVCSTVHKAKGLERPRVYLLDETFREGASTAEDNIFYVAVTRSQSELHFVLS